MTAASDRITLAAERGISLSERYDLVYETRVSAVSSFTLAQHMISESTDTEILESRQRVGTVFFWLAGALAILIFIDRTEVMELPFPSVWYRSRPQHVLVCVAVFASGWWLLRKPGSDEPADNHVSAEPLFDEVILYTRPDCRLCEEALKLLGNYRALFREMRVIDITGRESLESAHGDWIPVVAIDGRVRFRCRVDPWLLQRMVAARQRKQQSAQPETSV